MTPLERAQSWLDTLSLVGILDPVRVQGLSRSGSTTVLTLEWRTRDSEDNERSWRREIVVPLRDGDSEAQWEEELLLQLDDAWRHELTEGIRIAGRKPFDPHVRPRVWPHRAQDRERSEP